jgi:C1A family cysteine protease
MSFTPGWVRDVPDPRDFLLHLVHPTPRPARVSFRDKLPFVYDQGQLGSCTAHAAAYAYRYLLAHQARPDYLPSRLGIYYDERVIERSVASDAGAQIRDSVKVLARGTYAEDLWPYEIERFAVRPPAECYRQAGAHQALRYERVPQSTDAVEACLASGFPVLVGITCFPSLQSDEVLRSGHIPLPRAGERPDGGHALMLGGYDRSSYTRVFTPLNSWGDGVGDHGWFTLPYEYLTNPNLAGDFWCVKLVEG